MVGVRDPLAMFALDWKVIPPTEKLETLTVSENKNVATAVSRFNVNDAKVGNMESGV